MFLLVAGTLSVFAACGGACADDCSKACCASEEIAPAVVEEAVAPVEEVADSVVTKEAEEAEEAEEVEDTEDTEDTAE
mgnify:CR=1 FL=1